MFNFSQFSAEVQSFTSSKHCLFILYQFK